MILLADTLFLHKHVLELKGYPALKAHFALWGRKQIKRTSLYT